MLNVEIEEKKTGQLAKPGPQTIRLG